MAEHPGVPTPQRPADTDGRTHRRNWEPSLLGDSVGRWEGDTLIIETVNLTDRTWLDDHGNRHSDALRVTERWRRISADLTSSTLCGGRHGPAAARRSCRP